MARITVLFDVDGGASREALEQAGAVAVYDEPLDVHEHIAGFGQPVGAQR